MTEEEKEFISKVKELKRQIDILLNGEPMGPSMHALMSLYFSLMEQSLEGEDQEKIDNVIEGLIFGFEGLVEQLRERLKAA
jgi:hypothetical protein